MTFSLPFPHQDRARFDPARHNDLAIWPCGKGLYHLIEQALRRTGEAAVGFLLNPLRDAAAKQIRTERLWRISPKQMLAVGDANYSATSQFSMTPGASPAGYLLLTDIEDRTRALARLEQLQSDFVHMNRVSVMGELVASLSHEITQPIASARNDEKFKRAIASEIPYHFEQRLRRFDGEYRWFETRGGAVRDDTGRIVRWYVLLTDIEDRKRAQEVLRESERSLRLAIDGIDGLVGVLAPNGELQAANRQLFEYFGRSLEELKNWGTNDTEGASAKRAI